MREASDTNKKTDKRTVRIVPSLRYGKVFTRRTPATYRDARTATQLLQRGRMNAAVAFYNTLRPTIIRQVWQIAAQRAGCTGFNLFVGANINAFDAQGDIFDYTAIHIAAGKLQMPAHISVSADGYETVEIVWQEVAGQAFARQYDQLMVAAIYDNNPFEVVLCNTANFLRKEQRAVLSLTRQAGEGVHLYVFFATENNNLFSEQHYFRLN